MKKHLATRTVGEQIALLRGMADGYAEDSPIRKAMLEEALALGKRPADSLMKDR